MEKQNRKCLHCQVNKKILDSDLWFMVAIDKPYANLWFHRECYKLYNREELVDFLIKNIKYWYK